MSHGIERRHVVALSGGVGGAKLCAGLAEVLAPADLSIAVNTGDDFEHLGLYISPDIDSVVYALAGLADAERGWGRRDESWQFMAALRQIGGDDWFQLGDADLAMHVERTRRRAAGDSLSTVTADIARRLGIDARVLPMTDAAVRTRVRSGTQWLDFQDYFVRQRCAPPISELRFDGAATAAPQPDFMAALQRPDLLAVVICPSNPYVSIDPILALPGVRSALQNTRAPVIAVTPIIGGQAVKGPAAKMMRELGFAVSSATVAAHYAGIATVFISDSADEPLPATQELRTIQAATLMRDAADRKRLASVVLTAAEFT